MCKEGLESNWILNFSNISPQTVANSCACLGHGCCWTTWGLLEDWQRWWFVQAPCKLWHSCKKTRQSCFSLFPLNLITPVIQQVQWTGYLYLAKLNLFQEKFFKPSFANKNLIGLNRTLLKMYEIYKGQLSYMLRSTHYFQPLPYNISSWCSTLTE